MPASGGVGDPGEARFHARVRRDFRIVVPEAARAALGIREGDLVSVGVRRVAAPQGASP